MSKDNNGYIQGSNREQQQLLPPSIEEYVAEDSPVRFIDAIVQELDIAQLGLSHHQPVVYQSAKSAAFFQHAANITGILHFEGNRDVGFDTAEKVGIQKVTVASFL